MRVFGETFSKKLQKTPPFSIKRRHPKTFPFLSMSCFQTLSKGFPDGFYVSVQAGLTTVSGEAAFQKSFERCPLAKKVTPEIL
ncbi:hypothetical protein IFJ82_13725 [Novacetimonas hansenii]|uniref:hypothetical protein n=1 Tax=Novacetimonas hansenii TaxID=436 RepID=UPI0012BA89D0|nr:hypothetical protein [Novacetimonas hansenii]QOF94895.1 hypothetical protein IFJ82_13725 [Novacetimonas hansenii]